jgi:putative transposase
MHAQRFRVSVTTRCPRWQVSRSGYDAWATRPPSAQAMRRQDPLARIRTLDAAAVGRYGSPPITAVLQRAGERIAVKTVAPLCARRGCARG